MGFDPSSNPDFATRLSVQEELFRRLDAKFAEMSGLDCVTDRSPIDLIAYPLAEAIGNAVPPELQERFDAYIARCYACLNRRFSAVVVIQPGIPIVAAPGKLQAQPNKALIEHLNTICLGLVIDERCDIQHFYLSRHILPLEDRVQAIYSSIQTVRARSFMVAQELHREGVNFH